MKVIAVEGVLLMTKEMRKWSLDGTGSQECFLLAHPASRGLETAITSMCDIPLMVLKVGP